MTSRQVGWHRGSVVLLMLWATASVSGGDRPVQRSSPPADDARLEALKAEVVADVDARRVFTQQMVDMIFSFGELGFQEFETSTYVTDLLRKNGFEVEEGLSGIPTAWLATWGSGKPVIAIAADIDGIPQSSQRPGVAYHDPLVPGAPGHGEGHSAGQALNVTAALAVKAIMEREGLSGTLMLWPGVAEEQIGTKAYFVRDGYFENADVAIQSHVSNNLGTFWGSDGSNGLVSVEYTFEGQSAHSAGAPWRGRSALDAVELMDVGVNFRREHLRITQRTHSVITNGGDQPNVVPTNASIWYYFRESDYPHIKALWEAGNAIAEGAALMTDTTVTSRILGSGWPRHMNRPLAEALDANIQRVGLPTWSEADQTLARAVQQRLWSVEPRGLATTLRGLRASVPEEQKRGGGTDDIGDVSWNLPTVRLMYPANIPGGPGHHWTSSIAMATPIAHKGTTAGAKALAMTLLDILLRPSLVPQAWEYFEQEQTAEVKYIPFIGPDDRPAIWLNRDIMEKYRPEMRKYYFDPTRFETYLEQLGVTYPTVTESDRTR